MATTNTPQEPTIEALRVPEERRKSSTEMLNIMADFENSQGFPLLEGHWLEVDDSSSRCDASSSSSSSSSSSDTDSPATSPQTQAMRSCSPSQTNSNNCKNENLLLPMNESFQRK